jgi:hypothetical protein
MRLRTIGVNQRFIERFVCGHGEAQTVVRRRSGASLVCEDSGEIMADLRAIPDHSAERDCTLLAQGTPLGLSHAFGAARS